MMLIPHKMSKTQCLFACQPTLGWGARAEKHLADNHSRWLLDRRGNLYENDRGLASPLPKKQVVTLMKERSPVICVLDRPKGLTRRSCSPNPLQVLGQQYPSMPQEKKNDQKAESLGV